MTQKIDRSDNDYNSINWQDDLISIARHSRSHVQIMRQKHRFSAPRWSIELDVTSGHRELHVASGNRLACIGKQYVLSITCGEYKRGDSLHNYRLHHILPDGQIAWSLPWQTIERFTLVNGKLLVVRYLNAPHFWIQPTPLEAHLIEPKTGDVLQTCPVTIPEQLHGHYQSWQVKNLAAYLVWKNEQLVLTVRPRFTRTYAQRSELINHGSFKQVLTFK